MTAGRKPKRKADRKDELLSAQVGMDMKRELEELAIQRDVPASQLVREAIRRYLEQQKGAVAA